MQDLAIKQVRGIRIDRHYNAINGSTSKIINLKDIASLLTDFSRYNRVLQVLRMDPPNGIVLPGRSKLQLFLSNFKYSNSLILNNLETPSEFLIMNSC